MLPSALGASGGHLEQFIKSCIQVKNACGTDALCVRCCLFSVLLSAIIAPLSKTGITLLNHVHFFLQEILHTCSLPVETEHASGTNGFVSVGGTRSRSASWVNVGMDVFHPWESNSRGGDRAVSHGLQVGWDQLLDD